MGIFARIGNFAIASFSDSKTNLVYFSMLLPGGCYIMSFNRP